MNVNKKGFGGFTYEKMLTLINEYSEKYSFISVGTLCESILGQSIPIITLGEGACTVVYLGGMLGYDRISPQLILQFLRDICSLYEEGGSAFGFSARGLLKDYTLMLFPMLNPDGAGYCANGIEPDNPLRDRLVRSDNASGNFLFWEGNARGVNLRYNFGLEESEYAPEVEVGVLSNFFRFGISPDMVFELSAVRKAEPRIYYGEGERESKIATALTQMSGFGREFRENEKSSFMLADWAISELSSAAFSVELSFEEALRAGRESDHIFSLYAQLRKLFICAPRLNKL